MLTVFVHRDGRTTQAGHVDRAWLDPGSGVTVWVDLADPNAEEARVLSDVFRFHALAVEDALAPTHHPKIEPYDGYLYLIVHGIDFRAAEHQFATHDYDFFLGPNYLVTVHDTASRSVPEVAGVCLRNDRVLAEGPAALLHRIVDKLVDHYSPEVDKLEDKLDELERDVFESSDVRQTTQRVIELKRDVASLRRVILPQRDVLSRLARREFAHISEEVSYRFRDVHDHVVRIADEAVLFQDRITALLEAHLSMVSFRLNEVMKVLTIIATIFMPLGVVTGVYGMNVDIPLLPGARELQFWWVMGLMAATTVVMLAYFRRKRWI